MEVEYTSHFTMAYRKMTLEVRKLSEQKEIIFKKNPLDSRLKSHKLHGKLKNFYSLSVNSKIRIVFKLINRSKAVFLDIGGHDIYR